MVLKSVCEGVLLPLITPFSEKGELDTALLRELTEFYVKSGVNGLFVAGSAGQGPVLQVSERKVVAETVVDQVRRRIPLVLHVGCADTQSSVELAQHAKECGASAIAAVSPYYYPGKTEHEIMAHLSTIARSVDLPFYLYDNPGATGIHLTPRMVYQLVQAIPTLAGMKASFAPAEELLEYVRVVPREFGVFTNLISNVPLAGCFGIRGVINPTFAAFPELQVALWKATRQREYEKAISIYEKFNALNAALYEGVGGDELDFILLSIRAKGFKLNRYPRWERKQPSKTGEELILTAMGKMGAAVTARAVS